MNLFTQHNFAVVRQIADHTDSTTYYVRAVIRKAYSDEIITTLDLDSKGSQRYSKAWKIPADPSGQGFYISIVTSVYTDSGYTTKSSSYGDEEQTYLVVDREPISSGRGGGGSLGRRDIRDIITEELAKFAEKNISKEKEIIEDDKPEKEEKEEKDYDKRFDALEKIISKLPKEKPEKINFKPILNLLTEIKVAVESIEMPQIDFNSVIEAINELIQNEELNKEDLKAILVEFSKKLEEQVKESNKSIGEMLASTNFVTSFITHATPAKIHQKEEQPKEPEPDLSKLSA